MMRLWCVWVGPPAATWRTRKTAHVTEHHPVVAAAAAFSWVLACFSPSFLDDDAVAPRRSSSSSHSAGWLSACPVPYSAHATAAPHTHRDTHLLLLLVPFLTHGHRPGLSVCLSVCLRPGLHGGARPLKSRRLSQRSATPSLLARSKIPYPRPTGVSHSPNLLWWIMIQAAVTVQDPPDHREQQHLFLSSVSAIIHLLIS